MYRINWRNLAILVLTLTAVVIFYKDPDWVVELLPDHFSDRAKPDDAMVFVICLLGVIAGLILVLLDRPKPPTKPGGP